MRAVGILQERLGGSLSFMHAKQLGALWRVVGGLLKGQELWLTELGRSLDGACAVKHRIKAVDRFVGNAAIQMAITKIYAALASFLLRSTERPVLLVDWTALESGFYILSAQIAFAGRALSVLSRTYPAKKQANPDVERAFLDELKAIVPPHCRPVLVTDAGFLFKWIDAVRASGWDYIGRARLKKMLITVDGDVMRLDEAYGLANRKPRNLGTVWLGKSNPRPHRAVLSARPKLKGRQRIGSRGKPINNGGARTCRAAAREPLLLITSLPDAPRLIVEIYRMRMQIEETFRDLKSHRYGWSMRHIRSACPQRVDVLLLVSALAAVAMHLVGLATRGRRAAQGLQANTERRRTVFSSFFLGRLVLKQGLESRLSTRSLRDALRHLLSLLRAVERMPT